MPNTPRVPGRVGRILERPWFWIIVVALSFGVPLYRSFTREIPPFLPLIAEAEPFSIRDQDGKPLPLEWLRGAVVVVGFVETPCESDPCRHVLERMSRLQNRLLSVGFTIRLLSWGKDPARDTPEALKALGQSKSARFKTWSFVSGTIPNNLKPIAERSEFAMLDQLGRLRWTGGLEEMNDVNLLVREIAILINSDSALPTAAAR